MTMRSTAVLKLVLVATSLLQIVIRGGSAEVTTTVTRSTQNLRGRPVIHTRRIYKNLPEEPERGQLRQVVENLVDPSSNANQHRSVMMRGSGLDGKTREVEIDLTILNEFTKNHHKEHEKSLRSAGNNYHHGNRVDSVMTHPDHSNYRGTHFDHHEVVEHNQHPHEDHSQRESRLGVPSNAPELTPSAHNTTMDRKVKVTLPAGTDNHFNESLFEELHNAPFEIYAAAFGHRLEGRKSFPVFIIPQWKNETGIFSGFSRTATPLIFENMKFLLTWDDIVETSPGADDSLLQFMDGNNFHSTLIIGKAFGEEGSHKAFLGLLVSYFQGTLKHILVPFATLDQFFHDTSEEHLMSESTKHLEMEALHEMLDEKRLNDTSSFYHPMLQINDERKQRLEDMETMHFRRLFQLLIRRSFLFSFGYADCLKTEPHALRDCLDETYSIIVQMETTVRGALDEQIVRELAEINEMTHYGKVREACLSGSGSGSMYGMGSCGGDFGALGAFTAYPATYSR